MSLSRHALFPFLLCLGLLAIDGAAVLLRRRSSAPPWWSFWAGHITRPLAALSLGNGLYRLWPATFKFNPLTFPLWANSWSDYGLPSTGQAARTSLAAAGGVLVLFVLRRALASRGNVLPRLAALWAAIVFAQLAIALAPRGWEGVTLAWTAEGKVYAWAARQVDKAGGSAAFLDRYDEIQPRQPVHARSHPAGATLLSRWTQNVEDPSARGNVLRLLLMTSLNVPLLYLLGRSIFDRRIGLAAAALFALMPATVAFGTYSQDTVYSVFFGLYLLLGWEIARRHAARRLAVLAGAVLFLISMLTFSWSIVAAAVFLFVLLSRLRRGDTLRRTLPDLVIPPAVMLLCHGAAALLFGHDYYAAYRESYAFHSRYYPFAGIQDWIKAFVGGQLDFLWAMGPLVAGTFVVVLARRALRQGSDAFFLLFWSVLACYAAAVIFGPNPLKLETARCWHWVTSLPVLAAAHRLSVAQAGDDRPLLLAAGSSIAASLLFVSFLHFGA